jgi:hypothetical protein
MGVVKKLAAVVALGLLLVSCTDVRNECAPRPRRVLLIVLDGCRADYLTIAALPNLQQLARRGTTFSRAMGGIVVSDTPPSMVTLATGSFPNRHHAPDFVWRSSAGEIIEDFSWPASHSDVLADWVAATGAPVFARDASAGVNGPVVAVSGTKYFAAVGLGLGHADYTVFMNYDPDDQDDAATGQIVCSPANPCFVDSPPGQELPAALVAQLRSNPDLYRTTAMDLEGDDTWTGALAATLVGPLRPGLMMVVLPAIDLRGHLVGGPRTPEKMTLAMINADHEIGRILDAYRQAGLLDETLVIVTGDHGMVGNDHVIDTATMTALVQEQGARVVIPKDGKARQAIMWLDPIDRAPAVAAAMVAAQIDGLLGVYVRHTAPDGSVSYVGQPGSPADADPTLDAAYSWLLATVACAEGPDIVLATREDTIIDSHDPAKYRNAYHTEVTWGAQHMPLIMAGPGIATGLTTDTPALLVDLAPTIAAALGLPYSAYQGLPLVDALTRPPDASIGVRLAERSATLQAVQDRLIAQCEEDTGHACEP